MTGLKIQNTWKCGEVNGLVFLIRWRMEEKERKPFVPAGYSFTPESRVTGACPVTTGLITQNDNTLLTRYVTRLHSQACYERLVAG